MPKHFARTVEADTSGGQREEKTAKLAPEANLRLAMKSCLNVIGMGLRGYKYFVFLWVCLCVPDDWGPFGGGRPGPWLTFSGDGMAWHHGMALAMAWVSLM